LTRLSASTIRFLLVSLLIISGYFTGVANSLAQTIVKEIRFKKTSAREERVLMVIENFQQPKAFDLPEPSPRLVFDFLDARLRSSVEPTTDTQGELIKRIRVGRHPAPRKKVRVVLDLVPDYDYSVNQIFFQKNNVYAIMVTRSD
jgi:hypothetical protein